MKMGIYKLVITVWIYMLASFGGARGQVNLTPAGTIPVDEDNSVTLTCTYTGTEPVALFTWYEVVGDVGGLDDTPKGYIIPPGCTNVSVDATKYSYTCTGNKQVTWTIKNIDRYNDGDKWSCSASAPSAIFSNDVSIAVKVPILSVSMNQPSSDAILDVKENTIQSFTCITSGLPATVITWYKDNKTPGTTIDDIQIQQNITVTITNTSNGLKKTTSTLSLYPVRADKDNRIYCSANNNDDQIKISIRKPKLDVLLNNQTVRK